MTDDQENDDGIHYGFDASEESLSFYYVFFLSILAVVLVFSSMLHNSRLAPFLPEAGLTVIIGLIAGGVIYLIGDENVIQEQEDDVVDVVEAGLLSFQPSVFFNYLLPPIIFNSGYHINKELFQRYFRPIALYACLGTAISTAVVALTLYAAEYLDLVDFKPSLAELFTFGALISATDPVSTLAVFQQKRVDPQLFYFVFGESVLNDAVGIVLFNTLSKFVGADNTLSSGILLFLADFSIVFVGSMVVGLGSGIVAAYIFKITDMRKTRLLEICSYISIIYVPFFIAEAFPLSGIICSLFNGIAAKQYAEPNLSPEAAENTNLFVRVIAHIAETVVFLELGLSVFGLQFFGNFHPKFVLFAIIGCLLGRFLNIYPITYFYNLSLKHGSKVPVEQEQGSSLENRGGRTSFYPTLKIDTNTARMLWFSGLRGAVAYVCAKDFPNNNDNRTAFVVTTIIIVLLTVFLLGGTTECVLSMLDIEMDVDEEKYMKEQELPVQESLWDRIEQRYIYPWVVRDYVKPSTIDNALVDSLMNDEVLSDIQEYSTDYRRLQLESDQRDFSVYDYGANTLK